MAEDTTGAPIDESLREVLSPKALATLEAARALERVAAAFREQIAAVRAEGVSPAGDVWSVADGEGFLVSLAIDDTALAGTYTLEDLEDVISDAMIDASGRGQAAGERLFAAFAARVAGLSDPNPPL